MSGLCVFWRAMALHLWQTSVVLALVFVLDAALRKASSRASHALWSIGFAKLFLPYSLFGGAADFLYRRMAAGAPEGGGGVSRLFPAVAAVLDPIGHAGARAWGATHSIALAAATFCYAAIAACLIARLVAECIRASRCSAADPNVSSEGTAFGLGSILEDVGVPPERLVLSRELVMPAVFGLVRPVILLPARLAAALTRDELRAIILHEEAHRRRRDPLRMALWRLGGALFFFYPPVFFVLRRLRETAEYTCDEDVLRAGVSGGVYAGAIARTLNLGLLSPTHAAAAVSGESLLRRRFGRLTSKVPRRYAMSSSDRIIVAAAVLLVAAAAFYPRHMDVRAETGFSGGAADRDRSAAAEEFYPFDSAPTLTAFVPPAYPKEAEKLGATATVLLAATVGADGEVRDAKVIDVSELECGTSKAGDSAALRPLFERAAIDAVMRCSFEPATLDGKPVPARVAIPFRFRLKQSDE